MKLDRVKILLGLTSFFLFLSYADAKRFASKYAEFELPPGWECALEGTEYVCQSENKDRQKESIIILAAKIRGEQDTLDEYMAFLKKPKEYSLPGGKKQVSDAKNTKLTRINNQQWVDALHLASEVPGFYTRYLATVKDDLGIAVTFSVSKDLYTEYLPIIEKLVSTLRVFQQRKSELTDLRSGKVEDTSFADTTFNPNSAMDLQVNRTKQRSGGESGDDGMLLIIALIVGAGLVMVILKGKKKTKKKQK
jgi:hypothetical protein